MKNSLMLFVLWVAATASTHGQESQSATKLTYKEAIKIALKNNVILNSQKNNLISAQVQKNQRVAAFFPQVGINGSASRTSGRQPAADGGELIDVSTDQVNGNIQGNVALFNGLNRVNSLNASVNQFKAQTSFVKRSEQDVVFNVSNQYLQVLLDQQLLKIAEETFRAQGVLLDQLKEQVSLGARAESDQYIQDAQVRNLELIALRAKVTLENDNAILAQTLQLDPAIPFEVELPSLENTFELSGVTLDSLYAIALANREDLKQVTYQTKANLFAYRASLSTILPSVTLFGSYGSWYNTQLGNNFQEQFKTLNPQLQYGVNLTIPIFDRLQTRTNRVVNKMIYENSKLQEENIKKTVKIDVKRTYSNYQTAIRAYQASETQLRAGELALATQQESYVLGLSAQVALAQANQTFVVAAASRAQAEVTLIFQKMMLEYALGTLNPEAISQ